MQEMLCFCFNYSLIVSPYVMRVERKCEEMSERQTRVAAESVERIRDF